MRDDQSESAPGNKPFRRINNRQGRPYAQTLPPGQTGLYLVVQAKDNGACLEIRERFKHGRGRLRNKRQACVMLSGDDAAQFAAILHEPIISPDQHNALVPALETRIADVEHRATQAEAALADAQTRRQNASKVATRRFKEINTLRKRLAAAERRAQEAEAQAADLSWLREETAAQGSMVARLPQKLRRRLTGIIPIFTPSLESQPIDDLSAVGASERQVTASVNSDDAGERFLAWLQRSIADDVVSINQYDSTIHVLPEGLALLSPAIFRDFDAANWSHVQKRFQKLKLHSKTPQDTNIWTCQAEGKRAALFKIFLIPNAESVLGTTLPAPSRWLTLLGQEDKTSCA